MNPVNTADAPRGTVRPQQDLSATRIPTLSRRLAAMLYEGVLLFGVVMIAGFAYATLTQQRHALSGRHGLQAFMFLVLGVYFVWFWSRGRQTVAMKTWHLQLQTNSGEDVSPHRALARYLLSWLWFLPALLLAELAGWHSSSEVSGALIAGVLAYASLSRWMPQRQFLHDRLCGTRLVHLPRPAKPGAVRTRSAG